MCEENKEKAEEEIVDIAVEGTVKMEDSVEKRKKVRVVTAHGNEKGKEVVR